MEKSLIIIKPSGVQRGLIGPVIKRFQQKGLQINGIKMMQLDEEILRRHYAHLVDRPFFPNILKSMMASPVIVMVVSGKDAIIVIRQMVGATNGRQALPGTIRGDYSMSGQENIIHASDSPENAALEIDRFFKADEIFEYRPAQEQYLYSPDEI